MNTGGVLTMLAQQTGSDPFDVFGAAIAGALVGAIVGGAVTGVVTYTTTRSLGRQQTADEARARVYLDFLPAFADLRVHDLAARSRVLSDIERLARLAGPDDSREATELRSAFNAYVSFHNSAMTMHPQERREKEPEALDPLSEALDVMWTNVGDRIVGDKPSR